MEARVDVDAVLLFGYGFPRHRGGPFCYADQVGPAEIVARINTYSAEDSYFWQVPDLLAEIAETGRCFSDLNQS